MTPEEFEEAMKKLHDKEDSGGDREECHITADDILCEVLVRIGYEKGVRWFEKMGKWYS